MRAGGAEVALQLFAGGLAEIDGDEAIDGVGEGRIDVEGGEFAAEFQVVFDEDGDAFTGAVDIGDEGVELIDIVGDDGFVERDEGEAGLGEGGQIVTPGKAAEAGDEAGAGERRVGVADADGAIERGVLRVRRDISADGFPEQQQRFEVALVGGGDEGPAEFDGRAEALVESRREAEESVQIAVGRGVETVAAGDGLGGGIPEDELLIGRVETVEIAGLAGAFAGGTEGEFALAADFAEGMRGLVHLQSPDFESGTAGEAAFRRKRGDFSGDLGGRGGGGDGALRLQAEGGEAALGAHGFATGAEVGGGGVATAFDPGGRGGVADADLDGVVPAAEEFAGEHGGTEGGVGKAGDVEGGGVATIDPHGDDFGAGAAGEADRIFVPFGFGYAEAAPLPVGDDAGGEDDEEAAAIEPLETIAQAAGVGAAGGGGIGKIDGETEVADAIDFEHLLIGEVADIVAAAEEEVGGDDGVGKAETMVGDDDGGAGGGDVPEFVLGGVDCEAEALLKAGAEFAGAGAGSEFTGETAKFVYREKLFRPGGEGHCHWFSSDV